MKRPRRDFALLCAPIVVAGPAFFFAVRLLHPPRDPNAKIVLTLGRDTSHPGPPVYRGVSLKQVFFPWRAQASDGTSFPIGFVYSEKLVASGHGNTRIIYRDPFPVSSVLPIGAATMTLNNRGIFAFGKALSFRASTLPVWTQHLEWQGEVVAAPVANIGATPASPATLRKWAQLPGAVRATKTLPIVLNPGDVNPIQSCHLEKAAIWNGSTRKTQRWASIPASRHSSETPSARCFAVWKPSMA